MVFRWWNGSLFLEIRTRLTVCDFLRSSTTFTTVSMKYMNSLVTNIRLLNLAKIPVKITTKAVTFYFLELLREREGSFPTYKVTIWEVKCQLCFELERWRFWGRHCLRCPGRRSSFRKRISWWPPSWSCWKSCRKSEFVFLVFVLFCLCFFLPSLFRVDLAVLVCRLQGFFRQPIGDVHNQRRHLRAQKIHWGTLVRSNPSGESSIAKLTRLIFPVVNVGVLAMRTSLHSWSRMIVENLRIYLMSLGKLYWIPKVSRQKKSTTVFVCFFFFLLLCGWRSGQSPWWKCGGSNRRRRWTDWPRYLQTIRTFFRISRPGCGLDPSRSSKAKCIIIQLVSHFLYKSIHISKRPTSFLWSETASGRGCPVARSSRNFSSNTFKETRKCPFK